ncbi:MAG: nucleotide exchange factor GrpE [Bacilli bacterium]|nr:nucleotide exchange factor GrpE [Bacilli bacterium]
MFNKKKDNNEETNLEEEVKTETPKEEEDKYVHVLRPDYEKMLADQKTQKEEVEKWKNAYYTAYADTQNLRKSLAADHQNAIKYRAEGFLENLIPALDCFYYALQPTPNSDEAKNYQIGFQYIYNQIKSALDSEGVSEIEPAVGAEFDPHSMQAVDIVEVEDNEKANVVVKVASKGYKLHDRLVKAAMVIVSKHKEIKAEEPASDKEEAHNA